MGTQMNSLKCRGKMGERGKKPKMARGKKKEVEEKAGKKCQT